MQFLKVLVDGVFSSGKSEFIRHLSMSDDLYNQGIDTHENSVQYLFETLQTENPKLAQKYDDMVKNVHPRIDVPTDEGFIVSYDFGEFQIDEEYMIHLYGTPGAIRGNLSETFFTNCFGVVFIIDASVPLSFLEAHAKLDIYNYYLPQLPLVVVANKQDKEEAFPADLLRFVLRLDTVNVPVLPCCAKTGEGVAEVMMALCEEYLRLNDI